MVRTKAENNSYKEEHLMTILLKLNLDEGMGGASNFFTKSLPAATLLEPAGACGGRFIAGHSKSGGGEGGQFENNPTPNRKYINFLNQLKAIVNVCLSLPLYEMFIIFRTPPPDKFFSYCPSPVSKLGAVCTAGKT